MKPALYVSAVALAFVLGAAAIQWCSMLACALCIVAMMEILGRRAK